MIRTYEIALAILFLDRLGQEADKAVIRSLGLRLAGGQRTFGGWGYSCAIMQPSQEKKLLDVLSKANLENGLPPLPQTNFGARVGRGPDGADNSNTQFAILALWAARRYGLPVDVCLAKVEQRFRSSQQADGWFYFYRAGQGWGSMTCVGILGLGVGRGAEFQLRRSDEKQEAKVDQAFSAGLWALAAHMKDPSDRHSHGIGPKGTLNYYFLWSVERVGVLCNLETIGGKDWYRWGVELLLPAQRPDGSWLGRGSGGSPIIDTSMALLFLKKSDLLPDLRETLQKRLKITDPWLDGKGSTPGKSPGEKSESNRKSSSARPG